MKFEVITHCWQFSALLRYQLSSFVWYAPASHSLRVSVCYCPDDVATHEMLKDFSIAGATSIDWNRVAMSKEELCNRAIGRNRLALRTKADWVWFADADYCVANGFFDCLAPILAATKDDLVYPQQVLACPHDIGKKLVRESRLAENHGTMLPIPVEHFVDHGFRKAIGGVQFVRGEACRAKGYCNGDERTLRPEPDGWLREISDSRFRRSLGTNGRAIQCAGLYRIRHQEDVMGARKKRADGSPT